MFTIRHFRMGFPVPPWATAELFIVDVISHHDPQPDPQLAGGGHGGFAEPFLRQLAAKEPLQSIIPPRRVAHRFAPQKPDQRVALLGQGATALAAGAGELAGNHSHVAGHRLAVGKARRIA